MTNNKTKYKDVITSKTIKKIVKLRKNGKTVNDILKQIGIGRKLYDRFRATEKEFTEAFKTKSEVKIKTGSPATQYSDIITSKDDLEFVRKAKKAGLTNEQIYKKLGIGKDLGIKWRKEVFEFGEAFKKGREELTIDLKNTLYTRALGYTKQLKEFKLDENGSIDKSTVKVKEIYVYSDACLLKSLSHLAKDEFGEIFKQEKLKAEILLLKKKAEALQKEDPENSLSKAIDNLVNLVKDD